MVLEQFFGQLTEILAFIKGLRRRGVLPWDGDNDYEQYARAVGSDGNMYRAQAATGPATGNVQDPTTDVNDPLIWVLDVPDVGADAQTSGPVAWGKVTPNGSGVDTFGVKSVTRTGENSSEYEYEIVLDDGIALTGNCVPIIQPVADIPTIRTTPSPTGFTVQFSSNNYAGASRTFYFAVFGS
ncbi:MAG: hypothetical protein F4Y84_01440 [Caldilineaceae bacterium SB0665_bin_25]|nr:hypothetical protein [Caldilineaceae bacterium SB0665_bin_25]